jgi:hypothetical protein
MKRPIKPFVVEVRKGQKSQKKTAVAPELPTFILPEEQPRESDALRRAEAALFGGSGAKAADPSGGANRSGRILETISDEAPAGATPAAGTPAAEAQAVDGKRRGRPPGSRNKPKDPAAAEAPPAMEAHPRRRGRPPRIAESVRKVELTPELASAALESIARASVARAPLPTRPSPRARLAAGPVKPPRVGKRGRPPKEKRAKDMLAQERLEQKRRAKGKIAVKQSARVKPMAEESAAPTHGLWSAADHQPAPRAPAAFTQPRGPLDMLPRLLRIGAEQAQGDPVALLSALRRPRAGERWKRRLRGAALAGYERRLKKSMTAPR